MNSLKEYLMTAREVTIKNLQECGYLIGKGRGRKGTEIFNKTRTILDIGRYTLKNDKRKSEAIKKIASEKRNMYVLRMETEDGRAYDFNGREADSLKIFDVKNIAKQEFRGVKSIEIVTPPSFAGYIKIGKYSKYLDGQRELMKDILVMGGLKIHNDEVSDSSWYEPDDAECFDEARSDGYSIVHGHGWCQDDSFAEYIDGRIYPYNDSVISDFWDFTINEDSSYLDEIDPSGKVSVYHRKGKDWYVSYTLNLEEYAYEFIDEDGDLCEEVLYCYTYYEDKEVFNKIVDIVKSWKNECEHLSGLYNRLHIGDLYSDGIDYSPMYCENILKKEKEDFYDLRNEIEGYLDYSLPVEESVFNAFEKYLYSNIEDKKLFGKYTHLQKLEAMANADGRELVYSAIGDFTEDMSYSIKYKEEEYHFSLIELYETTPEKLYKRASKGLSDRLNSIYSEKIIMKKAKSVFVGLEDSYSSGNCHTGTDMFCRKHKIDTSVIGGIRGDYLLELDFTDFTKRAVLEAIKRKGIAS